MGFPTDISMDMAAGRLLGKVMVFEFLYGLDMLAAASEVADFIEQSEGIALDVDQGKAVMIDPSGGAEFHLTEKAYRS